MLVDPDDGAVDHRVLEVGVSRQSLENTFEYALRGPSSEAFEDRVPKPEFVGKVTPGRAGAGDPEDGFDEEPIVRGGATRVAGLAGKQRSDPIPLRVLQHFANQG
jgi:hypothetical protein